MATTPPRQDPIENDKCTGKNAGKIVKNKKRGGGSVGSSEAPPNRVFDRSYKHDEGGPRSPRHTNSDTGEVSREGLQSPHPQERSPEFTRNN